MMFPLLSADVLHASSWSLNSGAHRAEGLQRRYVLSLPRRESGLAQTRADWLRPLETAALDFWDRASATPVRCRWDQSRLTQE
jgi:hypothetical protein